MTAPNRPFWSVRGPVTLGLATLALLVGGFGAWATMTELSGAIVAPGRIEVDLAVLDHADDRVLRERCVLGDQGGGFVGELQFGGSVADRLESVANRLANVGLIGGPPCLLGCLFDAPGGGESGNRRIAVLSLSYSFTF